MYCIIYDHALHACSKLPAPPPCLQHIRHTHTKRAIAMYADSLSVVRDLPKPEGRWELVEVIG